MLASGLAGLQSSKTRITVKQKETKRVVPRFHLMVLCLCAPVKLQFTFMSVKTLNTTYAVKTFKKDLWKIFSVVLGKMEDITIVMYNYSESFSDRHVFILRLHQQKQCICGC